MSKNYVDANTLAIALFSLCHQTLPISCSCVCYAIPPETVDFYGLFWETLSCRSSHSLEVCTGVYNV